MATLDYQLSVDMGLVITREEAECQINRKVEIPKAWQRENQKQVTGAIIFSMKSHRIIQLATFYHLPISLLFTFHVFPRFYFLGYNSVGELIHSNSCFDTFLLRSS